MTTPEIFGMLAAGVGFSPTQIGPQKGADQLPESARLWESEYAKLLVLEVAKPAEESLLQAAGLGQGWIDIACMTSEKQQRAVIDGYLVLLCLEEPDEHLFSIIRKIELDPTACRKHVAWMTKDDDAVLKWQRMLRVTSLGLPTAPKTTGMTNSPTLTSETERLILSDVKELKGKYAAQRHIEDPTAVSTND